LDELDRDEMWDVARALRPGITREEFEATWADFQAEKRRKALQ
jgi:hypothetical protein